MRPYASGKLVVVFGAGGDRDAGKRPIMGRIAAENADRVIVTDDNPRSENRPRSAPPFSPRRPAPPKSATAAQAIRTAIAELKSGDVLLIAGKGHETGQIIGERIVPFSDHEAVAAALQGEGGMKTDPGRHCPGRAVPWGEGGEGGNIVRGGLSAARARGL